jgi:hypothetical protein
MTDMRVVENVTENHEVLEKTLIIPGFRWCDFEHCPELPETAIEDKWDLYLTDFATDCYSPLAVYLDNEYKTVNGEVVVPSGIWLRYHGLNLYALSSMMATNHAIPSDTTTKCAETACGRGVYTSRAWTKARQYAIPQQLEGSRIFTKVIALFVIPGASGEGGTAVWKKKIKSVRQQNAEGKWENSPSGSWCRRTQLQMLVGKAPNVKMRCLTPLLQDRVNTRRKPGIGEVPWTTADDTPDKSNEDQSSVVKLAGFFVTHCSASSQRRMICSSRESEFFVGWNEELEPPIGRPISSWEDIEPRAGRPTAEESKMTSDAARASVWESGSSVTGSPRGETQKKHAAQIRTYQDVDSETNLGSVKKLTGEPL